MIPRNRQFPIHTIWTHAVPHFDEWIAIVLLTIFGEHLFPGIANAKVKFITDGKIPEGLTELEFLKQGNLVVGVAFVTLDEHLPPGSETTRKENECAATLTAKLLGIEEDPRFKDLLKYVLSRDSGVNGQKFEIAHLAYLASQHQPAEEVLAAMKTLILGYLASQEAFWGAERDEFIQNATITEIADPKRFNIKVATVIGDYGKATALFRNLGYQILIQQKTDGHMLVAIDERTGLSLKELTIIVQVLERRLQGRPGVKNEKDLGKFGSHPEVPEWYLHPNGNILMNGSLSRPKIPETKIPLETIQDAVRIAFDLSYFEPRHAELCRKNSCAGKRCPWHCLQLIKCKKVRFNYKRATAT